MPVSLTCFDAASSALLSAFLKLLRSETYPAVRSPTTRSPRYAIAPATNVGFFIPELLSVKTLLSDLEFLTVIFLSFVCVLFLILHSSKFKSLFTSYCSSNLPYNLLQIF